MDRARGLATSRTIRGGPRDAVVSASWKRRCRSGGGTWPVRRSGSIRRVVRPVTALVAPGPGVTSTTPTCRSSAYPHGVRRPAHGALDVAQPILPASESYLRGPRRPDGETTRLPRRSGLSPADQRQSADSSGFRHVSSDKCAQPRLRRRGNGTPPMDWQVKPARKQSFRPHLSKNFSVRPRT